jgi:hypothetical protein
MRAGAIPRNWSLRFAGRSDPRAGAAASVGSSHPVRAWRPVASHSSAVLPSTSQTPPIRSRRRRRLQCNGFDNSRRQQPLHLTADVSSRRGTRLHMASRTCIYAYSIQGSYYPYHPYYYHSLLLLSITASTATHVTTLKPTLTSTT